MTVYILSFLFVAIIAIVAVFINEKRKLVLQLSSVDAAQKEKIEKLCLEYQAEKKRLEGLLNQKTNELNDLIQSEKIFIERHFDEEVYRVSDTVENLRVDSQKSFSNLEIAFNENLKRNVVALNEIINDKCNNREQQLNSKITALTSILEQVISDNNELRKKLEFFTEIDEDSKLLNEGENEEERELLIQQALDELKLQQPKEIVKNQSPPLDEEKIILPKESILATDESDLQQMDSVSDSDSVIDKEIEVDTSKEKKPVLGNVPSILDEEQKIAFSIMNNTNENLFITGKAGTGKSFLLEVFVRGTGKKTLKLAPTGIAALNIGGVTIHSAFGYYNLVCLDIDDINATSIRLKSNKKRILKEIDTFIIDEISMVRADVFDKIDKILRVINKSAKPFGGKQMIVFGDLFQLPPIAKWQETKYLTDYYGGIFFYHSNVYSNGQFGFIELSKNHRQKNDFEFFALLNRMREGLTTSKDIELLNRRVVSNKDELRRVLTLFPRKVDAERLNQQELAKIAAKEYVYKAEIIFNDKGDQVQNIDTTFPIVSELRLKRGALVMMVYNDPEKKWVNGTMGVVHSLSENSIHISIDGTTYEIGKHTFVEQEAVYVDGHVEYKDVLKVEQYPVVLAYAITIHKSQGMTYQRVACDISQCFAAGQAYVALSRCSNLDGLHLLSPIDAFAMKTDTDVTNFYLSLSREETIEKFS